MHIFTVRSAQFQFCFDFVMTRDVTDTYVNVCRCKFHFFGRGLFSVEVPPLFCLLAANQLLLYACIGLVCL